MGTNETQEQVRLVSLQWLKPQANIRSRRRGEPAIVEMRNAVSTYRARLHVP